MLTSAAWAQAPGRALFSLDQSAQRAPLEMGVVRAHPVSIDVSVIAAIRTRLEADPSSPQELALVFPFGNIPLKLVLTRLERVGDVVAIHGNVAGAPFSSVVLVERQGIVVANIDAFTANYQIRYRGPGFGHELREVDPSVFREQEREPREPKVPDSLDGPPSPGVKATQADDGSLIDVMVAYTPAVQAAAGGTAAVQLLIIAAVAETNAAYANSGVIQRLRLVHTMEVAYVESGDAGDDLNRLANKTDGFMDDVHAARDLHGADLVNLWTETGGCGLATLMATVGSYFEIYAFSVVSRVCATLNRSFAHELGHNMGLRHDVFKDADVTPFAYAHGYIDPPNGFRTIMAYNDGCVAAGNNCTRINYFSNPTINFNGSPTGVTATADARLSLNNTRLTVANFRASAAAVAPTITSANSVTFFVGSASTFTVTASGSPAPTFQLTGVLPNTLSFNNATGVLSGTPTLLDVGISPIQFTATNAAAPNAIQNFTLTIATAACTLDIDGNGRLDALTDGLMILRSLFGLSGNAVTAGAIATNPVPTRTTWVQVAPFLAPGTFDVDGNGKSDALTDGLMILRAMFGLTGAQVTNNAIGTNPPATRATWAAIRTYLNANCGSNFAP